ncbi:MAG: hypothetical protein RLZZ387_131 [Chloroflexota bacterium]|jgi:3-hydroxyisobutyrate dehydrogenase-like beta-hydroxyacid dehydrogenase
MTSLPTGEAVAVIGVGRMGGPMARNLRRAGFAVAAYDVAPANLAALSGDGIEAADSAAEAVARAGVVITMLPSDEALLAAAEGPEGVIAHLRPGQVLLDMGTSKLATSQRLAALVAGRGALMLDAPVSGGESGARTASLSIMVGGDQGAFERCRPVLAALGTTITYIGGNGMGLVAKLVNQILMEASFCAIAEAFVLALKAGADLDAVYAAVSGGHGGSRVLDQMYGQLRAADLGAGRELTLHHKDGAYALEAAATLGVPAPVTELTHALYDAALMAGQGQRSGAGVIKVLADQAGVRVPGVE